MAAAASVSAATRAILTSRSTYFSIKPALLPPISHRIPIVSSTHFGQKNRGAAACLVSGVDGGGVSDEFVSTAKSGFGREFSVIAAMLKRIEPLDNSIISKAVSDSVKDSMKQTISTMLGLLPSDNFSISIKVSRQPLDHLIVSSIVTGYTLWNAEYRISLIRNFDVPFDCSRRPNFVEDKGTLKKLDDSCEKGVEEESDGAEDSIKDLETNGRNFGQLTPEASHYIQQLESELAALKKEIDSQKKENLRMEQLQLSDDNLLEFLRSLQSEMVLELARPSSPEVEEIIRELSQTTLKTCFSDGSSSKSSITDMEKNNSRDTADDPICTSRDYLAKLLFWCMLLGHHLRALENRLQLSCVVGLL